MVLRRRGTTGGAEPLAASPAASAETGMVHPTGRTFAGPEHRTPGLHLHAGGRPPSSGGDRTKEVDEIRRLSVAVPDRRAIVGRRSRGRRRGGQARPRAWSGTCPGAWMPREPPFRRIDSPSKVACRSWTTCAGNEKLPVERWRLPGTGCPKPSGLPLRRSVGKPGPSNRSATGFAHTPRPSSCTRPGPGGATPALKSDCAELGPGACR